MKIGDINLEWLGHASFLIESGKIIYIDPYNLTKKEPKADIILLTHSHYDHCSTEDISKISKDGTIIIMPADCQSKITRLSQKVEMKILQASQGTEIDGIEIHAIPAYNVNKEFHPQSQAWNGYVIKINNQTIYHAGDTDLIPEMQKLAGKISIALLPVGGTYTMNAEEAAQAASIIKPQLAIPMHFGEVAGSRDDANKFVELCKQEGINAQVLEKS